MWKDSIRNIVVIFQPNILRIVRFYVRHSAIGWIRFGNNGHETSNNLPHCSALVEKGLTEPPVATALSYFHHLFHEVL